MKQYLGVKLIGAEPLNLGDYNIYRGWEIPSNEDPKKEGYLVKYKDGYESWSPKDVFEESYREIDNLTFGLAIEALKQGKLVVRKGWNGKGMFIMKQIPAEIGLDIIPKMQSVQESAKKKLVGAGNTLKYENQMLIIKFDGTADSWVASSSDIFAEDWYILED